MEKLVEKYATQGPRYTSYPPVPFWKGPPDVETWLGHVRTSIQNKRSVDVYIHVPFCESLCLYCGCARTITKDHSRGDELVDVLKKEWDFYLKSLGRIDIGSIHLGGGTPTFLRPEKLKELLDYILSSGKTDSFYGSIEVDPRTCLDEHLEVIASLGFSKVSMGIQDFDAEVQQSIKRIQPFEMVEQLMAKLRKKNFREINFDLIYGLPKQRMSSIYATIEKVLRLSPDSIAFYGYAHVPWKVKNQKAIKEEDLLLGMEKFELFCKGKELLLEKNYCEIGFDHFARKGSLLEVARENGTLVRNFMGYTHQKSDVILSIGPTAISSTPLSFIQNEKDLKTYFDRVMRGGLPIENGHVLSEIDREISDLVAELMCLERIDLSRFNISGDQLTKLKEFEDDGLGKINENNNFEVTPVGRTFLRNIAMIFDPYLTQNETRFSRTI